ncbi:Hypothetical predicted protein [Paramuricea clavata]|uniref:Uncharacterized protein n=1 Tax=Paramuricea clavata TaxID=317549 RepID=A0A7D9K2X1_PARCT|nr:Hypothetical predicted protein [Paramuricea clavata]
MEVCHECNCDSVEVFDGISESSRSLGKFCSGGSLKRISSGRSLFVKFTSDESNVGDAFTASYHMVAEGKNTVDKLNTACYPVMGNYFPISLYVYDKRNLATMPCWISLQGDGLSGNETRKSLKGKYLKQES